MNQKIFVTSYMDSAKAIVVAKSLDVMTSDTIFVSTNVSATKKLKHDEVAISSDSSFGYKKKYFDMVVNEGIIYPEVLYCVRSGFVTFYIYQLTEKGIRNYQENLEI